MVRKLKSKKEIGRDCILYNYENGDREVHKIMRKNSSYWKERHKEAIDLIKDHPYIPRVIEYDDNEYIQEYISNAKTFYEYFQSCGDIEHGMHIIYKVFEFMNEISKHTKENGSFIFMGDDIHISNIIIDKNGKFYIIDLDQFGYQYKKDYIQKTRVLISDLFYYFEKAIYNNERLALIAENKRLKDALLDQKVIYDNERLSLIDENKRLKNALLG